MEISPNLVTSLDGSCGPREGPASTIGALDGGSPMSHVNFKKWQCCMSLTYFPQWHMSNLRKAYPLGLSVPERLIARRQLLPDDQLVVNNKHA